MGVFTSSMGVFHVFLNVQMLPNLVKHHQCGIWNISHCRFGTEVATSHPIRGVCFFSRFLVQRIRLGPMLLFTVFNKQVRFITDFYKIIFNML